MCDRETNTSKVLEDLVSRCIFAPTFDARSLPDALACAASVLDGEGLAYVVAGRVAQARYCRAQCTDAVVVRVERRDDLGPVLKRLRSEVAGTLAEGSTVTLEVGLSTGKPERRWIGLSPRVRWLGTELPIALPEHLLWSALLSRQSYALPAAVDLIASGHVDWDRFIEDVGADRQVVRRAACARRHAEREKHSSYSASVARRPAARLQEPPPNGRRDAANP